MKVVHLVLGLGKGGAETMLVNLLSNATERAQAHQVEVVSLGVTNHFERDIKALGIALHLLDLRKHPFRTIRAARVLIGDADLVSSWLYLGNLFAWLITLGLKCKLIWNIRHADLSRPHNKWKTIASARIGALLSGRVSAIVYNGVRSRLLHETIGYPRLKGVVIDNGCDVTKYSRKSVDNLRGELSIDRDVPVVLSAARWDPIKDHRTFIEMFARVRLHFPRAVAVMCGPGIEVSNAALMDIVEKAGVSSSCRILGDRDDLEDLFSLADIYVLHSLGEAFPNTLLQAMSSGALVAATDVGDVSRIVDPNVRLAPPGDPAFLGDLVLDQLSRSPSEAQCQRHDNRARVVAKFSICEVVSTYERIYFE